MDDETRTLFDRLDRDGPSVLAQQRDKLRARVAAGELAREPTEEAIALAAKDEAIGAYKKALERLIAAGLPE